jgi:membrane dipeptidase
MRKLCNYDLDEVDLSRTVAELHTDIGRLRHGGVTGQFWSVYVPSTMSGPSSVAATLEQIDFVYRMVERYPGDFAMATSADDIDRARTNGRIASLIGIEGGHSINGSLAVLRMMYDLGARYMTLTHNDNVAWADSATDVPALNGMNEFGHDVVREMNRLGMLVDLSHVSADVMRQAIATSVAPVIFSHSSTRAVCDVPRNVPDDVLETVPANGGVCMITFVPDFVSPTVAKWLVDAREKVVARGGDPRSDTQVGAILAERADREALPVATVDDVVSHLQHAREVMGIDHLGIGGDFDGTAWMPSGLHDVACYPALFCALADVSWSTDDIEKLSAGNILRALRDVESVAR